MKSGVPPRVALGMDHASCRTHESDHRAAGRTLILWSEYRTFRSSRLDKSAESCSGARRGCGDGTVIVSPRLYRENRAVSVGLDQRRLGWSVREATAKIPWRTTAHGACREPSVALHPDVHHGTDRGITTSRNSADGSRAAPTVAACEAGA